MDYTSEDICLALKEVGLDAGTTVMVVQDIRLLGIFGPDMRRAPQSFVEVLLETIDPAQGTLVMPTSSMSLCNTQTPFDIRNTPSESGVITEYFRKLPGAVRSHHPFVSYTAFGVHAEHICTNNSRHAFGPHSPEGQLVEMDGTVLAIGRPPNEITSTVHHAEHIMAVPYRYTKEFLHPILKDQNIVKEPFYCHVWYRDMELERDGNKKIFKYFLEQSTTFRQARLGRGIVSAFSAREFTKSACELMAKDSYVWLKEPPQVRPFQR